MDTIDIWVIFEEDLPSLLLLLIFVSVVTHILSYFNLECETGC